MQNSLSVVIDSRPYLLQRSILTAEIMVFAMFLDLFIGICMAIGLVYGNRYLRFVLTAYVWLFRGVPVVVLLFLFYFGLFTYLGWDFSAFTTVSIVLGMTSIELAKGEIPKIDPASIISAPEELAQYAGDASTLSHTPELVVRTKSVGDIQALLELANIYHFPVTPRGGGSGLAGACLPSLGGVVLLTGGLNRITAIDRKNFLMKVEPGVISQQVRQAADAAGLFYPPDPAGMDLSTIGGNAATDAGGSACVTYGTTRDDILGLEAVLPDGQLIVTGVQTRKGVVGYDLMNLLVGGEGTLGIITSLTLKLLAKPAATKGMMCVFKDMVSAMNCMAAVISQGFLPSAIEFLDHRCLSLIGELLPFSLPGGKASILIIEVDVPQS